MNKLQIGQIFGEAYGLTFGNLGLFVRVAALPVALILLLDISVLLLVGFRPPIWMFIAQNILSLVIQVPILTSWHRFALLKREQALPTLGFAFRIWELRYLRYMILLWLCFGLIVIVARMGITPGQPASPGVGLAMIVLTVVVVFVWTRCGLVFPASAVGARTSMAESWQTTLGNGWRVFWALVLVSLPFVGVMFVLTLIFAAIVQASGASAGAAVVMSVISQIISAVFAAIYAASLSVIYRELAGYDPTGFQPV